jgi:cytochrome c-type biogenesis protein CcmH
MRINHYLRVVVLALALAVSADLAAVDITRLEDPQLQARYEVLTHELRCMKCQNQSIADSPVGLASDLRRQVQELLLAGKSDDEVRAYMVDRYGDFILFRPRFNLATGWVWIAPLLLLLGGIFVGARIVRARSGLVESDTSPVDTEEAPR